MTDSESWPAAGKRLLDELAASRDRHALVAADDIATDLLVSRFSTDLGLDVVRVGSAFADKHDSPPSSDEITAVCTAGTVLTDLDVLLWPALGLEVLPLLRSLARRGPTIAVWPGDISHGRARYSKPGRPDHHDERLSDVIVLRPRSVRFPDEMPYEIERTTR